MSISPSIEEAASRIRFRWLPPHPTWRDRKRKSSGVSPQPHNPSVEVRPSGCSPTFCVNLLPSCPRWLTCVMGAWGRRGGMSQTRACPTAFRLSTQATQMPLNESGWALQKPRDKEGRDSHFSPSGLIWENYGGQGRSLTPQEGRCDLVPIFTVGVQGP